MDTPQSNPLLAVLKRTIPGETFRLPSQGLFYTNGELASDVVNGEIHVLPLTSMDEITLKSPDMLMSGKAIESVFSKCMPQVLKPMELLSKDVDYLLMCLRLMSYGPTSSISQIHSCENAKQHEYEIELRPIISKSAPIDPTTMGEAYHVDMPNGQKVSMRPAVFASVLQMYQSFAFDRGDDEQAMVHQQLINVISDMIVSVDGETDRNMIREWLQALPPNYLKCISDVTEKVSHWGPDLSVQVLCKDCGEPFTTELPINPISFFM